RGPRRLACARISSAARGPCNRPWNLVGALAAHHRWNRLQRDLDVETQAPVFDVIEVHQHHLIEVNIAAPAHLPQSGDARRHLQPRLLPVLIFSELDAPAMSSARLRANWKELVRLRRSPISGIPSIASTSMRDMLIS